MGDLRRTDASDAPLPIDWQIQLSRAYAMFGTGDLDHATEFRGGLDHISAAERAKNSAEAARERRRRGKGKGGGQFEEEADVRARINLDQNSPLPAEPAPRLAAYEAWQKEYTDWYSKHYKIDLPERQSNMPQSPEQVDNWNKMHDEWMNEYRKWYDANIHHWQPKDPEKAPEPVNDPAAEPVPKRPPTKVPHDAPKPAPTPGKKPKPQPRPGGTPQPRPQPKPKPQPQPQPKPKPNRRPDGWEPPEIDIPENLPQVEQPKPKPRPKPAAPGKKPPERVSPDDQFGPPKKKDQILDGYSFDDFKKEPGAGKDAPVSGAIPGVEYKNADGYGITQEGGSVFDRNNPDWKPKWQATDPDGKVIGRYDTPEQARAAAQRFKETEPQRKERKEKNTPKSADSSTPTPESEAKPEAPSAEAAQARSDAATAYDEIFRLSQTINSPHHGDFKGKSPRVQQLILKELEDNKVAFMEATKKADLGVDPKDPKYMGKVMEEIWNNKADEILPAGETTLPSGNKLSFEDIDISSDGKQNKIIDHSGRKTVVADINGVNVPFYLSTGRGGKEGVASGKWYPYFGHADTPESNMSDGYFNKGSQDQINDYYGMPELKEASEWLDANVGDIQQETSLPKSNRLQERAWLESINRLADLKDTMHPRDPAATEKLDKNIELIRERLERSKK